MGGTTDFLMNSGMNALDPGHLFLKPKTPTDPTAALLAQQQAELEKQRLAQQKKEEMLNRQRMADMRARSGSGWGGTFNTGGPSDSLG